MTREIKFRAWDKNLKRFAHIELLIGCITLPEMIIADFEFWQQYTGLLDKNGVEIYEGDLVRYQQPMTLPDGATALWDGGIRTVQDMRKPDFPEDNPEWLEIIGNIYENPGLLK